ncbi:MAG: hypothetical protein ACRCYR_16475 [Phycicoccus sp.]
MKKPPIDRSSVQSRLERARADGLVVGIRRWIPNVNRIDGFVVGIGKSWVTVALLDDVRLDGWVVLRLKDIQAVAIDPDADCFQVRVLRARGQWPPTAPELDLSGPTTAIASAARLAPVVAIHVEFDRPDICREGKIVRIDDDVVALFEISTSASWFRAPTVIDVEDVTRVDFGGDYESALGEVAGPPPAD